MKELIFHPWEPVCDARSKILILGTIPSPESRKLGFYYAHPQNRFWKTLAAVLETEAPERTKDACKAFLLANRIALWDVLASCEIDGASDSSIRNPVPNDFSEIFAAADIRGVFTTGKTATRLFAKLCAEKTGHRPIYLPSTSPANCAMHEKTDFFENWQQILEKIE